MCKGTTFFCNFAAKSKEMNKIEQFVYQRVKNNYVLKDFLRNIYQGIYDLLPNYDSQFNCEPVVLENSFFGFHDVKPFSTDNCLLLSNRLTIPLRMPTKNDVLEVGYYSGEDYSEWHKVDETSAWNYHKGCRLQWLDEHHIIYNTCKDDRLNATICDITTGAKQFVNWPIDSVSGDGKYATSFSYGRLEQQMPGYGYAIGDDETYSESYTPEYTGLYLVDLQKNKRQMLLSLNQLSELQSDEDMANKYHFVTHTEFSPDGRYVAFLHRWYRGTFQRTRLIVYDLETSDIYISPTTGMVSHYVWNSQNGIVAYCRMEDIDSHVYFTDPTMREWKRCGYPKLNSDGHHHFIDDETFVVDTYPDKYRHMKLWKVSVKTDEVSLLADVKSLKQFVNPDDNHNWKCDLHPRVSADGTLVSFDSTHTGVRSLCVMRIQ